MLRTRPSLAPLQHVYSSSFLSALANQGRPLWWATTHRAHHAFCDTKRAPHSPSTRGVEPAFAFFLSNRHIPHAFLPHHLRAASFLWFLDTWAFSVHSAEMCFALTLGGLIALLVAFTSAWMCQRQRFWFNLINHPVKTPANAKSAGATETEVVCIASNYTETARGFLRLPPGSHMPGKFPPFHLLNVTTFFLRNSRPRRNISTFSSFDSYFEALFTASRQRNSSFGHLCLL